MPRKPVPKQPLNHIITAELVYTWLSEYDRRVGASQIAKEHPLPGHRSQARYRSMLVRERLQELQDQGRASAMPTVRHNRSGREIRETLWRIREEQDVTE